MKLIIYFFFWFSFLSSLAQTEFKEDKTMADGYISSEINASNLNFLWRVRYLDTLPNNRFKNFYDSTRHVLFSYNDTAIESKVDIAISKYSLYSPGIKFFSDDSLLHFYGEENIISNSDTIATIVHKIYNNNTNQFIDSIRIKNSGNHFFSGGCKVDSLIFYTTTSLIGFTSLDSLFIYNFKQKKVIKSIALIDVPLINKYDVFADKEKENVYFGTFTTLQRYSLTENKLELISRNLYPETFYVPNIFSPKVENNSYQFIRSINHDVGPYSYREVFFDEYNLTDSSYTSTKISDDNEQVYYMASVLYYQNDNTIIGLSKGDRMFSYIFDRAAFRGYFNYKTTSYIEKRDKNLNLIWRKEVFNKGLNQVYKIYPNSHGYTVIGSYFDFENKPNDYNIILFIVFTNFNGEVLSTQTIATENIADFLVYPNPVAQGEPLTLQLNENFNGQQQIHITGLNGVLVQQQQVVVANGKTQIDVNQLAAGQYLISIKGSHNTTVPLVVK